MSDGTRWGLPDAAAGLVGAHMLALLTSSLWIGVVGADPGADTRTFGLAMAGLAGLWLGFVGIPWLVARYKGTGSLRQEFGFRIERADIGIGVAVGFGTQVAVMALSVVLRALLPDTFADPGKSGRETFELATGAAQVAMVLVLVVGAPVVEELLFRGLVQRALVRRLGRVAGIGIAAAVFAAVHGSVAALPGLFVFGVIVGALAERSGRLGPSIVAHLVFNATTVTVFLATR